MLYQSSRAELEDSRPTVLHEEEDALLVRCLDSYNVWALKKDVSVTPCLVRDGYWESWITSWFTKTIWPGMNIVDIGANCGYFTGLFSNLAGPDGSVVAYECSPVYTELLTRTQSEFDFELRPVALSDSPGEVTLSHPGEYTGSASIVVDFVGSHWGEDHHVIVPATTIDLEVGAGHITSPDLVKIDAESAEEMIWNGGWSLWNAERAPIVTLEFTPGSYSQEWIDMLFEYGNVTYIGFDGFEHEISKDFLHQATDWVMIVIRRKA